ncbi:hypothetical protein BV25DRAFT_1992141 [Artomyces pyxidatus]|uniref:Uncharacterized protein n=1 Tax=Artomyces pyxidatus TaxID=48021 RepID=A0ACB8T007_9AGAM|nr:hypothetical protein BV25DRAFT_1992141 [Artomyces pyxidatus]
MKPESTSSRDAPINPLTDADYFLSPVETLTFSLQDFFLEHISVHDICEAYRTLSLRIRMSAQYLATGTDQSAFAALVLLNEQGAQIWEALRRDINRPTRLPVRQESYETYESPGDTQDEISEDSKSALDSNILCCYALGLLADWLRISSMSSVFSSEQLELLLTDVLGLAISPQFPLKIRSTATFVLQVQTLPQHIQAARSDDLLSALRSLLHEFEVQDQNVVLTTDALRIISHLIHHHPQVFLPSLSNSLPHILSFLTSSSSSLRQEAGSCLGAYSRASLALQQYTWIMCSHTKKYLTVQTARKHRNTGPFPKLPELVDKAAATPDGASIWALVLIANLAVLLGDAVFAEAGMLRLSIMNIHKARAHHHRLVPHVWRTLIWAFGRLRETLAFAGEDDDEVMQKVEIAFQVVRQELTGGVALSLVGTLLGSAAADVPSAHVKWGVERAVEVIKSLLEHTSGSARAEGRRILAWVVGGVGVAAEDAIPAEEWRDESMLSQVLFDGSLLRADTKRLPGLVRSMKTVGIEHLRRLSEDEILCNWESLLSCWQVVVQQTLDVTADDTTEPLSAIWQSLLLVQSELTQTHGHLTASADFATQTASLLADFLPDPAVPPADVPASQPSATPLGASQRPTRILQTIQQLWMVVQNVFVAPWLSTAGSALLSSVLKCNFKLDDEDVCGAWSALCSDLVIASAPSLLHTLSTNDEEEGAVVLQGKLWTVVAEHWDNSEDRVKWQGAVTFLALPMNGRWELSDHEHEAWERILSWTISSASGVGVHPASLIESLVGQISIDSPMSDLSFVMDLANSIMGQLHDVPREYFPTKTLALANAVLFESFEQKVDVGAIVDLLSVLHNTILSVDSDAVALVLLALQSGLGSWIRNVQALVPEDAYNHIIIPVYLTILRRLESVPLTVPILDTLTPILVAPFTNIVKGALGPKAFIRFFEHTQARLHVPPDTLPLQMRMCMTTIVEFLGLSLPAGMTAVSSQTGTQTQTHDVFSVTIGHNADRDHEAAADGPHGEIIPDSQPSESVSSMHTPWALRSPRTDRTRSRLQESHFPEFVQGSSRRPLLASSPIQAKGSAHATPYVLTEDRDDGPNKSLPDATKSPAAPKAIPRARKRAPDCDDRPISKAKRPRVDRAPDSEPITHVSSPVDAPARSRSAPKSLSREGRIVMDCVEVEHYDSVRRKRQATAEKDGPSGVAGSDWVRLGREQENMEGDEDYDEWEVTPETPMIQRLTGELLANASIVPETPQGDETVIIPETIPKSRIRQRTSSRRDPRTRPVIIKSTSAPASLPTPTSSPIDALPPSSPPPLRRAQTTSLVALREAHAALARDQLAHMPVPELLDAARLLEEMHTMVNGQMRRALGGDAG